MLFVSLRDLQWRLRRFIIGVLATGLVFALALVLAGVQGSFHNEVNRAVDAFKVDQWVISTKAFGPFTSSSMFPEDQTKAIASQPGVKAAEPIVVLRFTVKVPAATDLNVIGVQPGGIVQPDLHDGRQIRGPGEIVVDRSLGVKLGSTLDVSGTKFKVVGRTDGVSFFAGTPVAFVTVPESQKLALGGAQLATAVVVNGDLAHAPSGMRVLTNEQVISDLRRPLEKATGTITFINLLLWIVAAGIIGSVLYLQAIERMRDFAVFKATGVKSSSLLTGLAFQAVILAICSAIAALLLSLVISPLMPMAVEIPTSAYIALPIIAVIVGLIASVGGLRRAITVDPALAFGGYVAVTGADLKIKDLVIEYSSGGYPVRPIDGLSLEAEGGQLVLLLGASGCGKTTLLSVLAAILTPSSGSAQVAGIEVTGLKGAALTSYRRDTVGVVFQAFNLVPSLNAVENVMVPLRGAGVKRKVAKARAIELLERVDLGHRLDHRPGDMSGGQQQRVAIARALAHDPPVILADEPTAHLDYIQVEGVLKLVRDLADDGRLVIVATHDERMIPLADAVVNLTPRADTSHRDPVRVELGAGDVLFRQGDHGDLVYVVESGEIEIVRARTDGTEEPVAVIDVGNYFGELGPMFGLQRSASARATGSAVVMGYGLRDFRDRFNLNEPKVLSDAAD